MKHQYIIESQGKRRAATMAEYDYARATCGVYHISCTSNVTIYRSN